MVGSQKVYYADTHILGRIAYAHPISVGTSNKRYTNRSCQEGQTTVRFHLD